MSEFTRRWGSPARWWIAKRPMFRHRARLGTEIWGVWRPGDRFEYPYRTFTNGREALAWFNKEGQHE